MESLKILLSAYACAPGGAGEAATGWRWALETASLGHDVWVMTRQRNRPSIEPAVKALAAAGRLPRLRFLFFDVDLPGWQSGPGSYALWQWQAYRRARRLHGEQRFDAVHHLTCGGLGEPCFLGRLGIPLVLGPLHGGERIPASLRRSLPWGKRVREGLATQWRRLRSRDPLSRRSFAQANLILVRTPDTAAWLPGSAKPRSRVLLEVGIDLPAGASAEPAEASKAELARELRLFYAGRFVHYRGLDLALRALADLRDRGVDASLTLVGRGPEEKRLRRLAERLDLGGRLAWQPWQPRNELLARYANYDVLLYPCLRGANGHVLLEALAHGLPVVCLQTGVPAEIVDSACGRAIAAAGRSEADVRHALVGALADIAADPWLRLRLRTGAIARARQFAWPEVVARVWGPRGMGCLELAARAAEKAGRQ